MFPSTSPITWCNRLYEEPGEYTPSVVPIVAGLAIVALIRSFSKYSSTNSAALIVKKRMYS